MIYMISLSLKPTSTSEDEKKTTIVKRYCNLRALKSPITPTTKNFIFQSKSLRMFFLITYKNLIV